jgi:glycosyltransferase involved in cell wall biosynthesis
VARTTTREGVVSAPEVSVVVAARNAADVIGACLTSLAAQTITSHEVIVVDDGSTDETAAIAQTHGAAVVRSTAVGASVARNLGVEHARGRIVAFTDADCTVPPTWLASLVAAMESTGATGVGGPQRNVFAANATGADAFDAFFRLAAVVSDYTRSGGGLREVGHNASCNSAYRKHALVEIGGFTPGLWPGEDVDLDLRLRARGARLVFVPDAPVCHHRPGTLRWFRQMMRRYGAAERQLVRRHGRTRRIDYMPTALVAVGLAHLLYAVPACRPWLLAIDATIVVAVLIGLVSTTPARHWVAVMVFAATAVTAWHAGWWFGAEGRA